MAKDLRKDIDYVMSHDNISRNRERSWALPPEILLTRAGLHDIMNIGTR